ncbi:MAG: aquaporin [Mycobacteriales bacterium]|nr:aquaporin [Mycobacteriales bacterium]
MATRTAPARAAQAPGDQLPERSGEAQPTEPSVVPPSLAQKALAELVGSALLAATVVGSGIAATQLTDDVGLQLLVNALVTGAALVALILALGPVSAALNPVVTLVERALGAITTRTATVLATAQVAGCAVGVVVANVMFELPAVAVSETDRSTAGLLTGEVVATFGLVLVVFGVLRSRNAAHIAYAVGGYITAAYWFTSSTSFANPAITLGRTLSDTFAGIAPASVPAFVVMQLLGGTLALLTVMALYPRDARS